MNIVKTKPYKLYIQFYLSTVILNMSFSIFVSILFYFLFRTPIIYSFSIFFMSLGFIITILVKQSAFVNKTEYYFYYNFGITKIRLLLMSTIINIVIGTILIIGYQYVK